MIPVAALASIINVGSIFRRGARRDIVPCVSADTALARYSVDSEFRRLNQAFGTIMKNERRVGEQVSLFD
ncbi:MAG: hypothetical protein U5O39_01755 [Gammaproteobacteria bacterium]|nr:hypothetical protein [Gammaproteobacteria bacterium]